MAGRCGTVERGHPFSEVDGVGEPRIWRAAVYFLSAAVLDAGGGAEFCGSVERGAGTFHRDCADDGGSLFVCTGAKIFAEKRGAFRRGLLRGESVCACDCLHAQRFCGTACVRADAASGADGAAALWRGPESPAVVAAVDGVFRGGVRDGMAIERACRRGGKLQRSAHFCLGSVREKVIAAFVAR